MVLPLGLCSERCASNVEYSREWRAGLTGQPWISLVPSAPAGLLPGTMLLLRQFLFWPRQSPRARPLPGSQNPRGLFFLHFFSC